MRKFFVAATIVLILAPYAWAQDDSSSDSEPGVFELGEIFVTAKQEKVDVATTVTTYSQEDIKAQGAQTVAEALDQLPGVDVRSGGKNQYFVSIRGFDQDNVKVLIDGVPVYEQYFRTLDLSLIPTDAISKIVVTKGASSVLYGANTMGGVINIITKKGSKEPVTELISSYGNNATQAYIFNHGAAFGDFNYWLTGSYRSSDGFELSHDFNENNPHTGIGTEYNEDGGTRDSSDYIKRTINAKIGYEPDAETKLYLSFDYHNNERGVPTEFSRYWYFTKWDQWHANLVGQKTFSDFFTLKGRVFYTKHNDELTDSSWDADHTTDRKWFETSAYDGFSEGAELQTSFDFGDASLVKLGFNYTKDNTKQNEYYDDECFSVIRFGDSVGDQPEEEYETDTYTFAIEDEINPTDKLSLVFGASYDYYDPKVATDGGVDLPEIPDSSSTFNPQAGIVYYATDATSIHTSVGKKTRFPHMKELYSGYAGGNPDLDTQTTIAYEIGVDQRFNSRVQGSITYFYNDITDLIDRREVDGEMIYINVDDAVYQGVEVALNMNLTDSLSAGANYTYLSAQDKETDSALPFRPRHKVNLDIRYQFPFGLTANVQGAYTQRQFDDDDPARKLPDFFLLNARLDQKISLVSKLDTTIFVEGSNLTDLNYDEGSGPEPGRMYNAGLALRF